MCQVTLQAQGIYGFVSLFHKHLYMFTMCQALAEAL